MSGNRHLAIVDRPKHSGKYIVHFHISDDTEGKEMFFSRDFGLWSYKESPKANEWTVLPAMATWSNCNQ